MNCTVMIGHAAPKLPQLRPKRLIITALPAILILGTFLMCRPMSRARVDLPEQRIPLSSSVILVDGDEATYVQFAAKDLSVYLTEISGKPVTLSSSASPDALRKAQTVIAIGEKMALAMGADLRSAAELGDEGSVIRSFDKAGTKIVVVAGINPHGTNLGVTTLMEMIRCAAKSPYLVGPIDLRNKPSISVRGFHMNGGWQLNHPYGFRTWTEEDWKRFVDIVWAERGNLIFIWPYVETMTVPLTSSDKAYLEEFRRITEYAQRQRGMEVWIMQSANRVAISDCGVADPMLRPHWINGCQKDMDPADSVQFEKIEKSFEALYQVVNNADAFCLIDADPGGWPQSPISDQLKIFLAARKLVNRYNVHAEKTKLVDWMWIGWGRHKFFTATDRLVTGFDLTDNNLEESDVAFMSRTIRNFKDHLSEPWELIAGMAPYLDSSKQESTLNKTVYLPYGTIEMEPAFPATNLGFETLRKVLEKADSYPELRGWMGNNELMLLQFPRSYYFMNGLWDARFRKRGEREVLQELSRDLYPDYQDTIADSFLALQEQDPEKIGVMLPRLKELLQVGNAIRAGALGRFLFPDRLIVARTLQMQLEIRLARQNLLKALQGRPDIKECARLVEDYFDKLLAWNKETGWEKTIDIAIWTSPIYQDGKDLTEAMSRFKEILGAGAPYTSYSQVKAFFDPITRDLLKKYGEESVMIGCIEPFKLAVAQTQ
jgi:hypothetical protein